MVSKPSDMTEQTFQPARIPSPPAQGQPRPVVRLTRIFAIAALILAGVLILTLTGHPERRDYIEYWSSAHLLLHHSDPYSAANLYSLEKAHGYAASQPIIMPNPPWTLFLIAPLGLVSIRVGLYLWTLAAVACVLAFIQLLHVRANGLGLSVVFAPAVACLCSGQSSPFLLLGFALYLRFHRSRPFWAGASLLLMAIKPHLFLIFWAVLLVDEILRRRIRLFAGFATALAAASALPLIWDPRVWQHYIAMVRNLGAIAQDPLPTASMLFRALIDRHAFWLLFVPSAIAVLWGLWYYARNRRQWSWTTQGMLLMLVCIFTSPYSWFSDEIVILPAIVFALEIGETRKFAAWLLMAINTIGLYIVLVDHAGLTTHAYIWTPAAWLAWFLYATYHHRLRDQKAISDLANQ